MSLVFKAALLYFAVVFGAGFIFGAIRTLLVVPQIGVRAAELMEMPFMFAIMILASRGIVRRLSIPSRVSIRISVGFLALALMMAAELSMVRFLQRVSIRDYFASRDPVSGTVYYILLVVFALLPLCWGNNRA